MLVFSIGGFSDATYLSATHYLGTPLVCGANSGCDAVTESKWATVYDIPVALFGAIYYIAIFLLVFASFERKKPKFLRLAAMLTPIGLGASFYFVYLQLFVIQQICYYCMGSAASSTILFLLAIPIIFMPKKDDDPEIAE